MTDNTPLEKVSGTVMFHRPGRGTTLWVGSVAFQGIELSAQTERDLRTQLSDCAGEIEVEADKHQITIYSQHARTEEDVRMLAKKIVTGFESVLGVAVVCTELEERTFPDITTELPTDEAIKAIEAEQAAFYETPPPPEPTRFDVFKRVWGRRLQRGLAWCRRRAEYAAPCIFAPNEGQGH